MSYFYSLFPREATETGPQAHGQWDRNALAWNPDFESWGTRWFSFNKQMRKQRPRTVKSLENTAGKQQHRKEPHFPSYRWAN